MTQEETSALALARVLSLLRREFPKAIVQMLNPRVGPFERILLTNPGDSKILDLTDSYFASHPHVLNLDELLVADGVIEALNKATSQQRVIRRSDGLSVEDL